MIDLGRLSRNRFAVLGRVGMDLYADPPGTRTEEATQFYSCMGGSAANMAAALVRLGGQADLITCVSDDAVGRFCRNELLRYGIGAAHVRTVTGEARTSLSVVETRLENTQSVIYRNRAADFELSLDDVQAVDFTSYGALVVTGTALASEPSQSATFEAMERATEAGVPVVLDVDYRPYSWPSADVAREVCRLAAVRSSIVIGNDVEFGVLAGNLSGGIAIARSLAAKPERIVVYKRGEAGAITFADGQETATGIYSVAALKPTGAGDAFMGGFLSSLASGRTAGDAVLRGSAAAAIVVSRVGCAPAMPTPADLDAFLASHPGPTDPELLPPL